MNDNFSLYKNLINFSYSLIPYLNNIPRNDMFVKESIQKRLDASIENVRYYVINRNEASRLKIKYLKDLIVNISMIDYYLGFLYSSGVLGRNKFNIFCKEMEEIRKIAYGVINYEKKSC